MGQGLGQARKPEVGTLYFLGKNKEKVLKPLRFQDLLVAGEGFEPTTSGL